MSNSLSAVHPELVAEWSDRNLPLTPDSITFGSNKKVWWKGACGHEWETSVKARSNGEKCPICSGARVVTGINDLSTLKPELASEWSEKNKIKPTEVSIGSHKKVIWKCKLGHKWIATVKSRTINKTGCPYCSHNKVLVGFNDLATLFPEVADEWSDRNENSPTEVMAFANSKAWWKCRTCGYEWNTLISTRSGGSKCPCCSGYTFIKGKNDLKSTHPQIAKEWSEKNYPLQPDEVNAKSRKNVWWHCRKCGNEWKSVINARVKGTVCPVCAEREVLAGYNDLATTDKQVLEEWDYELNKLKPTEVSRNSAKRAWWKCRYGHSWSMKINERTVLNKGCRICEQEYLSLFPALAISYYANLKGLKVELGSDRLFGIPLDVYIPLEQVAIQVNTDSEKIDILKEQLKDFDDWGKDNVKITKGAKSISILEPVEYTRADGSPGISYNVKKVFDVTQTNGRKAPAVSANRDPKALITTMLDVSPVEVASTDELPYPNMAAFYNNEKQTLYVKRNVGDSVAVAQCVAQELGHAQLSINSESYSRRDMGFQAVCIGYMLCKKYGVDTQNFAINRIPEGLASKEPKEIRAELSKTRNAMAEIHSHISDEMFRKKQERSKDYTRNIS